MFPDQQQNGGQPGAPYQPQPTPNIAPQQAANGQYAVVPPLPATPNDGHSGHNPYEFIVNPNTPKHASAFGGSNSFLLKIGLLLGGAVVLIIIIAIVASALAPKSSTASLTGIAQRQQEIIRISTAATQKAVNQNTQNFVTNVEMSVTSDQQQVLQYLSGKGTKLKPQQLALDQDTKTDALLANAASANNYDSVAVQTLGTELQTYESLLQTTYKQTNNQTVKALLSTSFSNASLLLKQAQSLQSAD